MSVLKIKDANNQWQSIPAIKGADGIDGTNGADGYSPTATVSKNGDTTTISITDKNGTTTTTVKDGTDGTNGRDGYVQYTAGNNITIENNVISATGGNADAIHYVMSDGSVVHQYFWSIRTSDYSSITDMMSNTTFKDNFVAILNDVLLHREANKMNYINISSSEEDFCTRFRFNNTISQGWQSYGIILLIRNSTQICNIQRSIFLNVSDGVVTSVGSYSSPNTYIEALSTSNTISYTPTASTHPATKGYVDGITGTLSNLNTTVKTDLVSAINEVASSSGGGGGLPSGVYFISSTNTNSQYYNSQLSDTSLTTLEQASAIINDAYKNGVIGGLLFKTAYIYEYADFYKVASEIDITTKPTYIYFKAQFSQYNSGTSQQSYLVIKEPQIAITGTWSGDTFTATNFQFGNSSQVYMESWTKSGADRRYLSIYNSNTYIPSSDYNPSTKLYTDKTHYENMAGYDSTKTQILKNINGTLTWVDE